MAVLESHREVIIRYLGEFDEVLKYANDLSGTVRLPPVTTRTKQNKKKANMWFIDRP